MEYTSKISVTPCRSEGSDKSEMVTQLLYGEKFEKINVHNNWIEIKIIHDKYICFIDKKQFLLSEELVSSINRPSLLIDIPFISLNHNGELLNIMAGSYIYGINSNYTRTKKTLKEYALSFLNAPYLWGGRTIAGIDCSGYTQLIYRLMGHNIPRDAYQQAEIGEQVSFVSEANEGDLAFFDNKEGRVTHVGIILATDDPSRKEIIHASGKVRIDTIDHHGIYDNDNKEYTHRLRTIRRI